MAKPGRVRDSPPVLLHAPLRGSWNLAHVGDASHVADYAETRNADLEGSVFEFPVAELVDAVPGDAGTATIETRAWIRDGDELRRQAEAVVALAAAFEGATGGGPSAG